MNRRLDTDPELLDVVRAADPMRDPRVQANAGLDTGSALRLLAPKLDRPPAPRRTRRRRTALRAAVLAGAIAAAVFAVANITSTGNGSAVPSAQAQMILRHIHDALPWPPYAIYEEETIGTVTARNGARFTTEDHAWKSTSPPYNGRLIRSWNGKVQWEQAFVNGELDLYDPRTNTVYLTPGVAQGASPDKPQENSVLAAVQHFLTQPKVKINHNATLDGKKAIELTFINGRISYWISPSTYQPLQSEDRWDGLPDGQGGVGISRYPIARVLTGSAASPRLLSLQAQHPGATVDHSPTDYSAALRRINNAESTLRRCSRSGCS